MREWQPWTVLGVVVITLALVEARQVGNGSALTPLDEYEIRQLYARFCHGLDSAADGGYLFADVFTTDGVYIEPSGRAYEGREQLAALAREDPVGKKGPTNASHYTTNVVIRSTRDGAQGEGYILIGTPPSPPGSASGNLGGVAAAGFYQDALVRTTDGWRIKKRTFVRASP